MRSLRLGVALAASALLLVGCTDPSPDLPDPTDGPTSDTSETSSQEPPTEDPSTEATETTDAAGEPEPPVFGTAANQSAGAATACVADALGAPLTFSTVLTATDAITLDDLTLETEDPASEVEILDAYVLPFTGGAGGLSVGDYPPADPSSAREDVGEYELDAGDTVIVGVGVTAQNPTTMTFVLTFHGADDVERTLTGQHEVTISDVCGAGEEDPEAESSTT
ncbi:hypothetical protein [Pseudactinotalea sp.]|uniref:hypothetical protein n=1 Tax=Pseudactinotalea sp. TaxID=1926260 RepID=UPI003B3AEC6C